MKAVEIPSNPDMAIVGIRSHGKSASALGDSSHLPLVAEPEIPQILRSRFFVQNNNL
jgi:hypothetical protein